MISHLNKILGQLINTRLMEVQVPPTYITLTLRKLKAFHQGRKSFTVKEMETTTGMLVFISSTAPWLKFLMSHIYVSIAAAIGSNTAHLRRTNKQFRQLLKDARVGKEPTRENTFAQSESAKAIHSCPRKHFINSTLQQELHLITTAWYTDWASSPQGPKCIGMERLLSFRSRGVQHRHEVLVVH